jgi:hypothetical protein
MAYIFSGRIFAACIALATAGALPGASNAETFVGSNVDARVLVAVTAPHDGVQALLPDGWTSVPIPGGPLQGANILFVFIDTLLQRDPEGEALAPSTRRAVALAGLGKQADGDEVRLYVMRIYTTTPDANPYGVNVAADITRTASVTGPANGARRSTDAWQITVPGGGSLSFDLDYATGNRIWAKSDGFPHSALNPDFSRIYRFDQLTDLVVSTPIGKPSSGDFSLASSLADLSEVLDGTEQIVAIIDTPVYARDVFLP